MFDDTTNSRSVSIALPGPTSPSHEPSAPFAPVAAGHVLADGVAVGQQHGVAAIRRERAVGLVGDRDLGHDRAALEPEVLDREGVPLVLSGSPVPGLGLARAGAAISESERQGREQRTAATEMSGMRSSFGSGRLDQARAGNAAGSTTVWAASRARSASGRMNSRPMMPPASSSPPRMT